MTVLSISITAAIIVLAAIVLRQTVWPGIRQHTIRRLLMRSGNEAEGIILQVQQTGVLVNNLPQLNIQLQVVPGRGQNFVIELKELVSFNDLPTVQPGAKLKVKYNPHNHKQVIILKNNS
jgi:hypothetical protein